jgi:hypothetical protein
MINDGQHVTINHDNVFLQHNYATMVLYSTYKYLNGCLLGAPREYVLHGLNSRLN